MKRAAFNAFRLTIMIGMVCAGTIAPGYADRLSHPIELGEKCKTTFQIFLDSPEFYKTFAYVTGYRGYACAADVGNQAAIDKCNEHGIGICKVYARSPINGKLAIVWEAAGVTSAVSRIRSLSARPLPVLRSSYESRVLGEGQCWEGPNRPIEWSTLRRCKNVGGVLMRNSYDLGRCQKSRLEPTECLRLLLATDAQSEGMSNAAVMAKHAPARAESTTNDAATTKSSQTYRMRGTLIVRKFPSYEAHEIARLSPDQNLVVERETADGWSFVKFSSGRHGYVRPNAISPSVQRRLKKHFAERKADQEAERKVQEEAAAKTRAEERKLAEAQAGEIRRMRVMQLQTALQTLGLYRGKVDGVDGAGTRSALDEWLERTHYSKDTVLTAEVIVQVELAAKEEKNRRLAIVERERHKILNALHHKHRYAIAVIIGNRDYTGRTPDVAYAENDADAVRKFVIKNLGYREGNIIDLRNASLTQLNATFGTVGNHKGRLFDYVRAGKSDVIVFYSGHGVPGLTDRKGYLLPVNADPNRAELNGYSLDTLLANLAKVPVRSMVVYLDACFSGESQKGMLVQATSGLTVEARLPDTSKSMVVVTAAQNDQFASWDEDAKHGLFTKHLLEALRGEADGEGYGNRDGKVTLAELHSYLDEEMTYQARRRWSRDQNASVQGVGSTILSIFP
jgi:peptidoglycan hydrolase-like protein with peptidoglycan-binding domain